MVENLLDHAEAAVIAAEKAGSLVDEISTRGFTIERKDVIGRDLQTEADRKSEELIKHTLHRFNPGIPFCGEEFGGQVDFEKGTYWLVDPFDGTSNFAYGIPLCAISIALIVDGKPTIGVVREIPESRGRILWAIDGGAALPTLDRKATWSGGLRIGSDWPRTNNLRTPVIEIMASVRKESDGVRILGSAVIGLSYVALGTLDVYFNPELLALDVAAASVFIKRMGGVVLDMQGNDWRPREGKQGVIAAKDRKLALNILGRL